MRTILLSLLLLAAAFPPIRAYGQGIEKEFETILNKVRRSYGLASGEEKYMLTWSGLNTEEGIRFCVEKQIHFQIGEKTRRTDLCHLYLKNTTVPDKVVTAMIREEAMTVSEAGDMWALSCSFFLLSDYPLEDETICFWASFFSDNRVIETQKRPPEASFGHPLRVSDRASGLLRGLLEREKRWGPDDSTYYREPNDSRDWQNRDKVKDALNAFLLREGLIEKAMRPSHAQWRPPTRTPPADTTQSREAKPRPHAEAGQGEREKRGGDSHLAYWLAAGFLLAAYFIFLSTHDRK